MHAYCIYTPRWVQCCMMKADRTSSSYPFVCKDTHHTSLLSIESLILNEYSRKSLFKPINCSYKIMTNFPLQVVEIFILENYRRKLFPHKKMLILTSYFIITDKKPRSLWKCVTYNRNKVTTNSSYKE